MTLNELHARLGAIIEEHNKRGWSERNDQEILVRIPRYSKKTGRQLTRSDYCLIERAASGTMGFTGTTGKFTTLYGQKLDPYDYHKKEA